MTAKSAFLAASTAASKPDLLLELTWVMGGGGSSLIATKCGMSVRAIPASCHPPPPPTQTLSSPSPPPPTPHLAALDNIDAQASCFESLRERHNVLRIIVWLAAHHYGSVTAVWPKKCNPRAVTQRQHAGVVCQKRNGLARGRQGACCSISILQHRGRNTLVSHHASGVEFAEAEAHLKNALQGEVNGWRRHEAFIYGLFKVLPVEAATIEVAATQDTIRRRRLGLLKPG